MSGEVTNDGLLKFYMHGQLEAEIPAHELVLGGGAPDRRVDRVRAALHFQSEPAVGRYVSGRGHAPRPAPLPTRQ